MAARRNLWPRDLCALLVPIFCFLIVWNPRAARADDETTYYDNGVGLLGEKKYAEAEAQFRKSIETEPRYKQAWQGLADTLKAEGKDATAAQKFADAAPDALAGAAPPLTAEQKAALDGAAAAPAPAAPAPAAPAPAAPAPAAPVQATPAPIPPALAPIPPAPAAAADDKDAEIQALKKKLADLEAAKGNSAPANAGQAPVNPVRAVVPGDTLKPLPQLSAREATGKPKAMVKLSQFNGAGFCDLAAGADGALHAVFTEAPDAAHAPYVYYRASRDGGATWSEPKNLSDDESGDAASYCRVACDAGGRVYAVWKYIGKNEILDGPGGVAAGRLVFRCLAGGQWSRAVPFNKGAGTQHSWFAAPGPGGTVCVVWSQMPEDVYAYNRSGLYNLASLIQQATLDGPALGQVKAIITPAPLPTKAQIDAANQAGHPLQYAEQAPRQSGLFNLRGYIDSAGAAHFVAESNLDGKKIVVWDGATLTPVYEYEKYQTYNIFNDPPFLLAGADGKEHLLRAPEKAEKASVRDYLIEDGKLGEATEAIVVKTAKGSIINWQASPLPGGRMAVLATVSQKGGWAPDDQELYVTFSDGNGKWSDPLCLTDNAWRNDFFSKETGGGNAVSEAKSYSPRFAAIAADRDGRPSILMVNSEDAILGITNAGVTGGGQAISVLGTGRTSSPMVYFLKP